MADFKFEVIESFGELSTNPKGWTKELNLVSFNSREPKYDIRDWSPEREKMGKGVTLSLDELKKLRDLLNNMDI